MTPFQKVLVANRGEIALRVMRSAKALGYGTVAVYSSADAGSAHVRAADQAVCIGDALPSQSYLRIPAIIDAAKATGADAVHPGYGFLAENEDFAQACRDAGLVFIGPSPAAIRAMGDKAGAKALMRAAGVPCIPGYQGDDQSEERLAREAAQLGYPVMIKATAGGGGRGMRLVESEGRFLDLLRSAQSEARNAFGDATVILERAIAQPRHVEIQVFADRHGNAVHLGERDCSVQRRHQKLIEEAPSPAVDATLRARMGATAVAAVKAIAYEGAGTLEFLVDAKGDFFFMEMNTRLQVEHPVTEAITGLDLVAWQLRVAAGEALPLAQEAITFSGHAMEVRLCAEDARHGFMPQSGTLLRWRAPASVRVEHALESGTVISPYYDSMVAKVIAHGATREEAARKLRHALSELVAFGVTTNQAFLLRSLSHPVFLAGGATTAFIGANESELLHTDENSASRACAVAAWLLLAMTGDAPDSVAGRLAHRHTVPMKLDFDGSQRTLRVRRCAIDSHEITDDDVRHLLHGEARPSEGRARFTLDGITETVGYACEGHVLWLLIGGSVHRIENRSHAPDARDRDRGGDGRVRASMNGRVIAVHVGVGDGVEAGQPVAVLEAMKMEHVHAAPLSGVVAAVHVSAGDQMNAGRVMVEIQPPHEGMPRTAGDVS
ncbi:MULTISPECIES: acetyl-CoA carboxylase biotin carboxylase subunit [unclassified Variovorax]|uniref:acetyl/propionyl/methylcrotonyl-CoA carboxylase subunit alpha n=1 Tax=unclassified Variovorax TaxID=663243 RepID=UPI0025754A38|nr:MULTISPECIES: acetyl-CoA carboxylase biotin carboxylase subunit [unclassified Variovorax]MDM0089675.1 acetyl-CoA carboxylase biotin carboxylase subunit [Variovorax sp. J22G40]MDM0148659.1 acetyl-CoA carboxylase biotin carboxylase subunit [Variovorax sp. J2P1-31]